VKKHCHCQHTVLLFPMSVCVITDNLLYAVIDRCFIYAKLLTTWSKCLVTHRATWEIKRLLCNPKIIYCVDDSLPLNRILYSTVFHPVSFYLIQIHFNNFRSVSGSYKWFLSSRFCDQIFLYVSPVSHMCYTSCPFHCLYVTYVMIPAEE
jgi:hypothetical protein